MVGFPHSEILGSKLIRSSPRLIAAYYVLHRLCTPRHPLDALKTLDRSHYLYPQHHQPFALLYAYLPPSSDWFPGTKLRLVPHRTEVRCMSEKKPKITSLFYSSPRVSGQTGQKAISLRCQNIRPGNAIAFTQAKLCSHLHVVYHCAGAGSHRAQPLKEMVEPDGIEPTTSCLQSRRSPS